MSTELEQIEARVMRLPAEDRQRLVSRLFSSLSDEPSDPAWEEEITSRIEKLENGTTEFRSIDEVFAEVNQRTA